MNLQPKLTTAVLTLAVIVGGYTVPALAGSGGAFIGGMITSKVLTNMHQRTQAEEYAAYSQPKTVVVHDSGSGGGSAEARIKQLDKLAAGGYITPAEYKQKKRQILDSL